MALIKKYKCMNIGNCKDANKTEIEIPVGEKLECPTCHKDMLVEVKQTGKGLIIGIAAAVLVLGGVGVYFGVFHGKESSKETPKKDPVAVVDPVGTGVKPSTANANSAAVKGELAQEGGNKEEVVGAGDTKPADVKDLKESDVKDSDMKKTSGGTATSNLGWASYEGPMSGGKPSGIGGVLIIKSNHSIDLKNGSSLDVKPGDKIVNTKFTNGALNQGELQRKNGERKYFAIG